jgi:GxxExxY protein
MADRDLTEEALTKAVIGAFYEVYNNLGYGFFEHVYVLALEMELRSRRLKVEREVWVPVYYKTIRIGYQRTDMLVERRLVVEAKSTEKLPESASRKLYNYLHATQLEIGLLLHFGPKAKFYPVVYRH